MAEPHKEKQIVFSRPTLSSQVYCALQIGYFKAKQMFFDFHWEDVSKEDIAFLIKNYWTEKEFLPQQITKYEYYTQTKEIVKLYDYSLWSKEYTELLLQHVLKTSRRDISIGFILAELLQFIQNKRIIRPGYTTLQDIISKAINNERERLGNIIINSLNDESTKALEQLLSRDDSLYYLSALKQDAKDFSYKIMTLERKKLETIKPLYILAKDLLPKLEISRQNILYYADLINYYTIYELRRLNKKYSYLYIICYIWQRYLQLTDNGVLCTNRPKVR